MTPRLAYPAPPHGDLQRRVDVVLVGLNPQLADYRVRCADCARVGLVREFIQGRGNPLRCRACGRTFSIEEADFVRPSFEDWTLEGLNLDAKGRNWINVRFDLEVLHPSMNLVNIRMCWWPSYDDQTIATGEFSGRHLLDLLAEVNPRVVVAYNRSAAEIVRRGVAADTAKRTQLFLTSGKSGKAPRRHIAQWYEPVGGSYGLIVTSQAQDAPNAKDVSGVTMRTWAATLAQRWVGFRG